MDILNMTALEISKNIKAKQISAIEVANEFISKCDACEPRYNSFITIDRDNLIKSAKAVQKKINKNISTSALAGVPIAIKDNICTKGIKTTCASKMLSNFVPFYNATVVNKLISSDLMILGKTNMDEFAMGSTTQTSYYGPTKSPIDLSFVPGGSSGGSACCVKLRECPIALGSDTGGSIRQPSSFCGVVGLKPTYASVSRYGLVAYASSLEQIGPIANNVLDLAALYNIIKGKDGNDNTSLNSPDFNLDSIKNADVKGLRIAVIKEFMDSLVDRQISSCVAKALGVYKSLGCRVEEISIDFIDYLVPTYYILACGQASSNLARYDGIRYGYCEESDTVNNLIKTNRTNGFGNEVKKRIMLGNFVLSAGYYDDYYKKALSMQNILKQKVSDIFKNFDAIIIPTTPNLPYGIDKFDSDKLSLYLDDRFSVLANLTGIPAMSIPCGKANNGLPIGMQIMANSFCENTIFALGSAYENAVKGEE